MQSVFGAVSFLFFAPLFFFRFVLTSSLEKEKRKKQGEKATSSFEDANQIHDIIHTPFFLKEIDI
jgi:hypothetical protein